MPLKGKRKNKEISSENEVLKQEINKNENEIEELKTKKHKEGDLSTNLNEEKEGNENTNNKIKESLKEKKEIFGDFKEETKKEETTNESPNNSTKYQEHRDKIKKIGNKPDLIYIEDYLNKSEQEELYKQLEKVDWQRVEYQKFGKTVTTPRKTFCYAQIGTEKEKVRWKGQEYWSDPFPDWLDVLRKRIEKDFGFPFNACILNCYEGEKDSITWHVDAEKFLSHKNVASLSIGGEREFKWKTSKKNVHSVDLKSGSLSLLINGVEHCVPKKPNQKVEKRYNITFRQLKGNDGVGNYMMYNRSSKYRIN